MKLSSDPEKATFPGKKLVFRAWANSQKSSFDILALDDEEVKVGDQELYDIHEKAYYNITQL